MPDRNIQTETPYILRVDVPFTADAGEQVTVYTEVPLSIGGNSDKSAIEIMGMLTDLEEATALFTFTVNGNGIWSSDQIPLAINFGKPGSDKPVIMLERPITIGRGQRIRGDLVNVGGEGAGTLYFIACQKRDNDPRVTLPDELGADDTLIIDSALSGVADERPARQTSAIQEEEFLVYDIHTNLNNATVRLFGIDGVPWSESDLHVWAFAGRAADAKPRRRLRKPYLIPAGHKMSAEFINGPGADVDAAGQIFLKGVRFPAVRMQ
jgi:hypothetical protein